MKKNAEQNQSKNNQLTTKLEEIDVEMFPLFEVLEKYQIGVVDFLSIDTEGSECDILAAIP